MLDGNNEQLKHNYSNWSALRESGIRKVRVYQWGNQKP